MSKCFMCLELEKELEAMEAQRDLLLRIRNMAKASCWSNESADLIDALEAYDAAYPERSLDPGIKDYSGWVELPIPEAKKAE